MRQFEVAALSVLMAWLGTAAVAAAPDVLHTPGYESPVQGDPDDLLMIAGSNFAATDVVVYQALEVAASHPPSIPPANTADAGTAPVVQRANPVYALTVRLPTEMQKGRAYRLWVVTANGEWSQAMAINDPRPQWITPSYVYSTTEVPGLGRDIRIVGRNLTGGSAEPIEIRLRGPDNRSYTLRSRSVPDE